MENFKNVKIVLNNNKTTKIYNDILVDWLFLISII
jgi:hypothetical protein